MGGAVIAIGTRRHFPLTCQLSKSKVIQLALEGSKFGMAKVTIQDMCLKLVRVVDLNLSCEG